LLQSSLCDEYVDEADLPSCTKKRDVKMFKSEVLRRVIHPNSSYCIVGNAIGDYTGNLSFVFNKLDLTPVLYYYKNGDWWKTKADSSNVGGASTALYRGFLYIENPTDEDHEFNIAYTTFNNDCYDFIISGNPDDYIDIDADTPRKKHCYFNGINGRQKMKLYSNNTRCDCDGAVYPKAPKMVSTYYQDLTFYNDQGSIQFAIYRCNYSYCHKSRNYVSVEAETKKEKYVFERIGTIPEFYGSTSEESNLALVLGLSLGIPLGTF